MLITYFEDTSSEPLCHHVDHENAQYTLFQLTTLKQLHATLYHANSLTIFAGKLLLEAFLKSLSTSFLEDIC